MTITQASALIAAALAAGQIDAQTASQAHAAVRAQRHYGNRMTPRDRASVLALRFGIGG